MKARRPMWATLSFTVAETPVLRCDPEIGMVRWISLSPNHTPSGLRSMYRRGGQSRRSRRFRSRMALPKPVPAGLPGRGQRVHRGVCLEWSGGGTDRGRPDAFRLGSPATASPSDSLLRDGTWRGRRDDAPVLVSGCRRPLPTTCCCASLPVPLHGARFEGPGSTGTGARHGACCRWHCCPPRAIASALCRGGSHLAGG